MQHSGKHTGRALEWDWTLRVHWVGEQSGRGIADGIRGGVCNLGGCLDPGAATSHKTSGFIDSQEDALYRMTIGIMKLYVISM